MVSLSISRAGARRAPPAAVAESLVDWEGPSFALRAFMRRHVKRSVLTDTAFLSFPVRRAFIAMLRWSATSRGTSLRTRSCVRALPYRK